MTNIHTPGPADELAGAAGPVQASTGELAGTLLNGERRGVRRGTDAGLEAASSHPTTARPPLTPQQARVLAAIRDALATGPIAPTLAELGERIGLSAAGVHHHVVELEVKGYLRRPRGYGGGAVGGSPIAATRAFVLLDADGRPAPTPPRLGRVIAVLRIAVPDAPVAPTCGHPRTGTNRWYVAGIVLCRTCGRAAVADHLARRTAVEAR